MNRKFKVISNFVMLSLTGLLLVMLSFGWYVVNKTSYVNGGTGLTSENDSVTFDTTVIAEIHYLNHVVTTETYTRDDDGSLYLIKRSTHDLELDTTTETNYELSSHEPFFIRSLLPGEYIDITIGYSISDDFDNSISFLYSLKVSFCFSELIIVEVSLATVSVLIFFLVERICLNKES